MRNITLTEWDALGADMAADLRLLLPLADVVWGAAWGSHTLGVRSPTISVNIALRGVDAGSMVPVATVGSSKSLASDLDAAQGELDESVAVLAAVRRVRLRYGDNMRWPSAVHLDGCCPCDSCSAGTARNADRCHRCGGKGVR